ncbi:glutamate 5-kinase [Mesobacillus zeae]|uniref:Glutamate 5-kinase n=1 Tax=Mesobacillus zeae TaxID=1917180 RepID=A0A398BD72_9BACI|nr:glutamate 5-kinase [Mesobacillus zeae]RID85710.1 glutamate 5-kinase [Mesobacillus zeae]
MGKQRIVIKIGSSSLTNEKGSIDHDKLSDHARAAAVLHRMGHDVILVSSGAVAAGFAGLGYPSRPETLKGRQAAAAVGQSLLIQAYTAEFLKFQITPAQILLTRSDFSRHEGYKNAYATISELLERRILPIINENDTVSVKELTFGDNDMLSALVAGMLHADRLIILTDIDGLYDGNPRTNQNARKITMLEAVTDECLSAAGDAGSKSGTGGMRSKLIAARTALSLGVSVFIGLGKGEGKLSEILEGRGNGTYIGNHARRAVNSTRQWITHHSEPQGKLFVDKGAEEAIIFKGKSLLPAGISTFLGQFQKGDVVEVHGSGKLLGKGLVSYSAEDLGKVIGKRSSAARNVREVIHRDKWVRI